MVATRTGANVPMVADRDLRLEEVIECVCVMMTCCYSLLPHTLVTEITSSSFFQRP